MKKKNLFNLVSLIVLFAVTTYILVQHKKDTTLPEEITEFAFDDTATITKIFIADMKGGTVILAKKGHEWVVNDQYRANTERIDLLLEVLFKLKVKSPVPESALDNVIKDMAATALKTEIYTGGDKPVKTYYVGGPTPDLEGTYMAVESGKKKEKTPYIIYLPDFRGYLSEGYFFTNEDDWRTKEVFRLNPALIKQVEINYNTNDSLSFRLEKKGEEYMISNSTSGQIPHAQLSLIQVKKFLTGFENLQFVAIDTDISSTRKDSVMESTPAAFIQVKMQNGDHHELYLYNKTSDVRTRIETKNGFDKERFWGVMPDRKEHLLILQTLSLKRILWKYDDFKTKI